MAKYTFEFKKKVVFEYLHGKIWFHYSWKKYNIKRQNQYSVSLIFSVTVTLLKK